MRRFALALAAMLATGCAQMQHAMRTVEVQQPLSVKPAIAPAAPATRGAIYQASTALTPSYMPLFEDRRARAIGDTLTVNINEKIQASKTAATTADRSGSTKFSIPEIKTPTGHTYQGGAITGTSASEFKGNGDSAANNVFTGTITVTVIDVLPNGNLVVAGEKQIGINQGSEFIRLSGVVNPALIFAGNVVSSTQIADARLEYRGTGYIDEAQTMGWAQRVFQSILPF
jgi:flagellar L-ring protein precursor FlgH